MCNKAFSGLWCYYYNIHSICFNQRICHVILDFDCKYYPIRAGSALVLAKAQSMTVDRSCTSLSPARLICPPEPQNPRAVYEITVYPFSAKSLAGTTYSNRFIPQLEIKITNGLPLSDTGAGSKNRLCRVIPSQEVMSISLYSSFKPSGILEFLSKNAVWLKAWTWVRHTNAAQVSNLIICLDWLKIQPIKETLFIILNNVEDEHELAPWNELHHSVHIHAPRCTRDETILVVQRGGEKAWKANAPMIDSWVLASTFNLLLADDGAETAETFTKLLRCNNTSIEKAKQKNNTVRSRSHGAMWCGTTCVRPYYHIMYVCKLLKGLT